MRLIKILLPSLLLLNTFADEVFVYKFNKLLVGKGVLKYRVSKLDNFGASYSIKSETKIYLLGSLAKEVQQVSLNRSDLTPIANSYCSYPKSSLSKYTCSTFTFEDNGLFSYYGLDSATLNSNFFTDEYAEKNDLDMSEEFSSFNPENKIYDLASFIMLPRYKDLNELAKETFYIALENYRIKITAKVLKHKRSLKKIKIIPAPGTPKKVVDQLPSFIIFDTKTKVVTQVEIPSPLGKIKVKLDTKESTPF